MGADESKPTPQPADMNTAIFQLKMASKRFARESKKSEKDKEKNMKKAQDALKKGDEETARLFATSAQTNINDMKKYLRMSAKLELIAGQIKSNHKVGEIVNMVGKNVNPILLQQVDNVDIKDMAKNFQMFQENFDKLTVNANIMSDGFDKIPAENTNEKSEDLFNQIKNKFQAQTNTDMGQMDVQKPIEQKQQANADFDKYLNDLKN